MSLFIGTETVLLAESHLLLRRANHPDLPFSQAYSYGKSTKNQRIEAWWNILTEGQTQEWKIYFARLESEGLFDGSDIDKSCLQYIYMDIIRSHIHNFVEVHNSHSIRRQPKRDHYLPTGKPFEMYFYPVNAENFREPVDETILLALESEVEAYDLDPYLPIETISLYSNFLTQANLPISYTYDNPQHQHAYSILRQKVWQYIQNGGAVKLFPPPTGASEWIQRSKLSYPNLQAEIDQHRDFLSGDTIMNLENLSDNNSSVNPSESSVPLLSNEILTTEQSNTSSNLIISRSPSPPSENEDGYLLDFS